MERNSRKENASEPDSTNSVSGAPKTPQRMDLMKLYQEICTNIRVSDDISFKLLGFVPILSGTGAAILSRIDAVPSHRLPVVVASVVGATFTFGLFKWELRNVQKCDVLIHTAAVLEQALLNPNHPNHTPLRNPRFGQYSAWKLKIAPPLLGMLPEQKRPRWLRVGKTQAERIIYWASIAAWLVPIMVVVTKQ